jgi:hypothetical protein
MPESFHSRLYRLGFNLYPAYRGTGGWITYIAEDWREIHVKIPLSWQTRNYVGTIFGGSLYAAVDPFYMIMLIKNLGSEYVVWDKAAGIQFKLPGRDTLYAKFTLSEEEFFSIKSELVNSPKLDRHYQVELKDKSGLIHALVEKKVFIARKTSE